MNTNPQFGNMSRSFLMMLCLCGGLVACTTTEAGGTGGSGGTPVGTGGTTVGSGGVGGAGTTGSTTGLGTLCLPPQQVITDFTYTPSDASTTDTAEARFGTSGTLQGGTAIWTNAPTPLTSDVTQNNWHISGTIENYSGFNLYFDNCSRLDASAYKGISFKISGSLGGGSLVMGMGTLNDAVAASWLISKGDTNAKATDPGLCVPTSGTNKYDQQTCADSTKTISVTATPTPVNLTWTDFTGGKPVSYVEPKDIISIYWYFVWTAGSSYPVDITLDDLSFISP